MSRPTLRIVLALGGLAACGSDPEPNGPVGDDSGVEQDDSGTGECTTLPYFADEDDDGFGAGEAEGVACDPPLGFSFTSDDCDDTRSDVHPGSDEICWNGVDDDCDGAPNPPACAVEGRVDAWDAAAVIDGSGGVGTGANEVGSALTMGDLDGDGLSELVIGASAGDQVAILWGRASGIESTTWGEIATRFDASSEGNVLTGQSLAVGVLVDGADPDLVIGGGEDIYVLTDIPEGPLTPADAAIRMVSDATVDYFETLAAAADLDGDGSADLVVGSPDYRSETPGSVLIVPSPLAAGEYPLSGVAQIVLEGEVDGDFAGADLASDGDVDGDGAADLAVTAAHYNGFDGRVYVNLGPIAKGTHALADSDWLASGPSSSTLGTVAWMNDASGDGYSDLAVAGHGSASGTTWILEGTASGPAALEDAVATFEGGSESQCGVELASGDLDADGFSDLAVGCYRDGEADLFYGPLSGSVYPGATIYNPLEDTNLGHELDLGGDTDGDGYRDFVVGASHTNSFVGATFLFPGAAR